LRLLIERATVTAHWVIAGTTDEIPSGTLVRPTEKTHFVLVGINESGNICYSDTLVISVHDVEFIVRADGIFCRGTAVPLFSVPPADAWFDADNNPLGSGNISITPPMGTITIYTAEYIDFVTGCTVRKDVAITVNPPDLTLLLGDFVEFGQYTLTVCEGDLVHLQTNIDPSLVVWVRLSDNDTLDNPLITATENDVFRAHAWDEICGDIHIDLTLNVEPMPDFQILDHDPICAGTSVHIATVPAASQWFIGDERVFMPIILNETQTFTGVLITEHCEVRKDITLYVESCIPIEPMVLTYRTRMATNRNCDNGNIHVTVTGGEPPYEFEWTRFSDESFHSFAQPDLMHAQSGVYRLVVRDSRDSVIEQIITLRCQFERVMPSILLTPNNDGLNDFVYIQYIELFPINTVTIINSYGEKIITIENYNNSDRVWGGKNRRGQFVPDGTYYYVVQADGYPPMVGWIIVRLSPGR